MPVDGPSKRISSLETVRCAVVETLEDRTHFSFTPAQVRQAYGLNNIRFNGTRGDGTGQTIAIIDVFNDPQIFGDVAHFNSVEGLPEFNAAGGPTFTIDDEKGQNISADVAKDLSPAPANATASTGSWDVEETLDVEWAHAVAPGASIILYEANSDGFGDLFAAADSARRSPGVSVVSMSFSGGEEASYDLSTDSAVFTTPAGHEGVTFLASTGDNGVPSGYPAYSPNVIAVGGTSLFVDSNGNYSSEVGWSSGGGGISTDENLPGYQAGIVGSNGASNIYRNVPDVSWLADPYTGVVIYDTSVDGNGGFSNGEGGTSLACPMWAGLIAIADQGRVLNGLGTLDGPTQTLPLLYRLPAADFNDITVGYNGDWAGPGYDLVTGLGTPVSPALADNLAGFDPDTTALISTAHAGDGSTYFLHADGTLEQAVSGTGGIVYGVVDTGVVTLVSAADGSVYDLESAGGLLRWVDGNATRLDSGVVAIVSPSDKSIWALETGGTLKRWSGQNLSVITITTQVQGIASGGGNLVDVTLSDGEVRQYNGVTYNADARKLTGTTVGTAGAWENSGNTIAKVFDGNLSTYFDAPTANGNTVGVDLGSPQEITQIGYAPRPGYTSRMVGGIFQVSNTPNFTSGVVNLYTITAAPPAEVLTLISVNTTGTYRYVRYLSPNGSYGNIAELQIFGPVAQPPVRLTGTVIGTSGSFKNSGNTIAKAVDGNLTTFFDGPVANGDWVGLDLGSAKAIKQISFAPRGGYASRMIGGIFQVSNSAKFSTGVVDLYQIMAAPVSVSLTTINVSGTFRYVRYLSPNGSFGDISEFQVFG